MVLSIVMGAIPFSLDASPHGKSPSMDDLGVVYFIQIIFADK